MHQQNSSDVSAVAEMLYLDLTSQRSPGDEVDLCCLKTQAQEMLGVLGMDVSPAIVLMAMEKSGYVQRDKRAYKILEAYS